MLSVASAAPGLVDDPTNVADSNGSAPPKCRARLVSSNCVVCVPPLRAGAVCTKSSPPLRDTRPVSFRTFTLPEASGNLKASGRAAVPGASGVTVLVSTEAPVVDFVNAANTLAVNLSVTVPVCNETLLTAAGCAAKAGPATPTASVAASAPPSAALRRGRDNLSSGLPGGSLTSLEGRAYRLAIRGSSHLAGARTRDQAASIVPAMGEQDQRREDGTAAWHRQLHHTGHDQFSEDTAQTPGMRRYEAISGTRSGSRKIWMGESHIAPGMVSGDHHHGEAETGIYVVSGHPVFVFLEDGRRTASGGRAG